jgi:hypothetical protein
MHSLLVLVGDAHGDLSQTRAALVLAGVLSTESEGHVWTGGRTVNLLLPAHRKYQRDTAFLMRAEALHAPFFVYSASPPNI